MKLFAIILSVYVIALTAMPCFDVHSADTNSFSIEISQQGNNQFNDVDLCSPFCYCNCCQVLSSPNIIDNLKSTLISSEFIFRIVEQIYPNPTVSFWRPPKI